MTKERTNRQTHTQYATPMCNACEMLSVFRPGAQTLPRTFESEFRPLQPTCCRYQVRRLCAWVCACPVVLLDSFRCSVIVAFFFVLFLLPSFVFFVSRRVVSCRGVSVSFVVIVVFEKSFFYSLSVL